MPLLLDIDDWEVGFYQTDSRFQTIKQLVIPHRSPNSYLCTWLIEKLTFLADDVTVSSTFLQKKFGGIIVPHGRDTNAFDPSKFDRDPLREKWNLKGKKVIMFFGTPRPHKGLEEVIKAVKSLNRADVIFMAVGAHDGNYVRQLKAFGGDKIKIVGMQPFHKVPEFLSMADLVVLPQHKSASAVGQIPAKVFDAMAMAKPVIATRVSDLPEILDGCGLIVEPEDTNALADSIRWVLENDKEAQMLGNKAREKCIQKYSWDAMEKILRGVFNAYENK